MTVRAQIAKAIECGYDLAIPNTPSPVTLHVERAGYAPLSKELSTQFERDECDHAKTVNVPVALQKT